MDDHQKMFHKLEPHLGFTSNKSIPP